MAVCMMLVRNKRSLWRTTRPASNRYPYLFCRGHLCVRGQVMVETLCGDPACRVCAGFHGISRKHWLSFLRIWAPTFTSPVRCTVPVWLGHRDTGLRTGLPIAFLGTGRIMFSVISGSSPGNFSSGLESSQRTWNLCCIGFRCVIRGALAAFWAGGEGEARSSMD